MNQLLQQIQDEFQEQSVKYQKLIPGWKKDIQDFYDQKMGLRVKKDIIINILDFQEESIKLIYRNYSDIYFEKLPGGGGKFKRIRNRETENTLEQDYEDINKEDTLTLIDGMCKDLFTDEKFYGTYSSSDNHIDMYVGQIRHFCQFNPVDEESLFKVVLAHELAHLYNHIGMDKDNFQWEKHHFEKANINIKEGLAQFYCSEFIDQKDNNGNLRVAFDSLNNFQTQPYKNHKDWDISLEQMYRLLIDTRRNTKIVDYASFESLMGYIKKSTNSWDIKPEKLVEIIIKLPRLREQS